MTKHKTYFFRRLAAFFVDFLLFGIFVSLMGIGIQQVTNITVVSPSFLSQNICVPANNLTKVQSYVRFLELKENEKSHATLCTISNLGFPEERYLKIVAVQSEGKVHHSRHVGFFINEKLDPKPTLQITPLFYALAPLLFGLMIYYWNTPGKTLLQIQVTNSDGTSKTKLRCICREYLRVFPFVLPNLFAIIFSGVYIHESANSIREKFQLVDLPFEPFSTTYWIILVVAGFLVLAIHLLYLIYIFKPPMFYDRLTGLTVSKRSAANSSETKTPRLQSTTSRLR